MFITFFVVCLEKSVRVALVCSDLFRPLDMYTFHFSEYLTDDPFQ